MMDKNDILLNLILKKIDIFKDKQIATCDKSVEREYDFILSHMTDIVFEYEKLNTIKI